jgi:hypothetical protein
LFDHSLPPSAKILYGQIKSLTYQDGYCFATNKYFADINNLSCRRISILINLLFKSNYIQIEYKTGLKGTKARSIYIDG